MRVCLMVEGQEGVTWDDWVRLARLAEGHGADDEMLELIGERLLPAFA